jgi:hypothetical protein
MSGPLFVVSAIDRSRNKSPIRAPLPSALQAAKAIPPIWTRRATVSRTNRSILNFEIGWAGNANVPVTSFMAGTRKVNYYQTPAGGLDPNQPTYALVSTSTVTLNTDPQNMVTEYNSQFDNFNGGGTISYPPSFRDDSAGAPLYFNTDYSNGGEFPNPVLLSVSETSYQFSVGTVNGPFIPGVGFSPYRIIEGTLSGAAFDNVAFSSAIVGDLMGASWGAWNENASKRGFSISYDDIITDPAQPFHGEPWPPGTPLPSGSAIVIPDGGTIGGNLGIALCVSDCAGGAAFGSVVGGISASRGIIKCPVTVAVRILNFKDNFIGGGVTIVVTVGAVTILPAGLALELPVPGGQSPGNYEANFVLRAETLPSLWAAGYFGLPQSACLNLDHGAATFRLLPRSTQWTVS